MGEGQRREQGGGKLEAVILLALKMEEGPMSQGMQEASRGWKSLGNELCSRISRENTLLLRS